MRFQYSFMIVLNVRKINTIIQKYKQLLSKHFSEHASYFNYRISIDTKGPINPSSDGYSFIHVIVDAFSHFVVTVPIKKTTQNQQ